MRVPPSTLKKMLVFALVGIGIVSAASVSAASITAPLMGEVQEQSIGKSEIQTSSPIPRQFRQLELQLGEPLDGATATAPIKAFSPEMLQSLMELSEQNMRERSPSGGIGVVGATVVTSGTTGGSRKVTSGRKTIAIDADENGDVSAVTPMSTLDLAAQIWSSASFPVEQFQAYTSPFGYRSSPTGGYRQEFHYGLDIAAPQKSYIRNWWAGTVIEVSDGGSCGTSIVIQSGEWTHMYCHMQGHVEISQGVPSLIDRDGGLQLWEGQQIVAGDRIGRVGMTGRTTGPHLHWGLKYQGNWVDPAWVLQAMAASHYALYGQ